MNPFNRSTWEYLPEIAGYAVLVVVGVLVMLLAWDMRTAARRRRQAKRDRDHDRWQDQ